MASKESAGDLFDSRLKNANEYLCFDDGLQIGRLQNKLEYRVLEHPFPHGRVQIYMCVGVGSLNEEDNEQGLAHFLEHCVFLGTEKFPDAESLKSELGQLGMLYGGDLNAHTDFHETVYTLSCPTTEAAADLFEDCSSGEEDEGEEIEGEEAFHKEAEEQNFNELRPSGETEPAGATCCENTRRCLILLRELCLKATLSSEGVSFVNEKLAVASEEQLRNTVAYRAEKKMIEQHHQHCLIPKRMPIGIIEQVKGFDSKAMKKFYNRWYRPDNMCVFVVGDIDAESVISAIEEVFESPRIPNAFGPLTLPSSEGDRGSDEVSPATSLENIKPRSPTSARHRLLSAYPELPALQYGPLLAEAVEQRPGRAALPDHSTAVFRSSPEREVVFQHSLFRLMSISIISLTPALPTVDKRESFVSWLDSLISHIFHSRIDDIHKQSPDPPFLSAGWDYINSTRENCGWNALGVMMHPTRWREGLKVIVGEVLKLAKFGVGQSELKWAAATTLKEYRDSLTQRAGDDSGDIVAELVADWSAGAVSCGPLNDYRMAVEFMDLTDVEVLNRRCQQLFAFIVDYFSPPIEHPVSESDARGSIFISAPSKIIQSATVETGDIQAALPGIGGSRIAGLSRAATMTAAPSEAQHPGMGAHGQDGIGRTSGDEEEDAPEFIIKPEEVLEVVKAALEEASEPTKLELPDSLLDETVVDRLMEEIKPSWIEPQLRSQLKGNHLETPTGNSDVSEKVNRAQDTSPLFGINFHTDPESGITLARLSNGIRVNFKRTDFEANCCSIKIFAAGGRLAEPTLKAKPQALCIGFKCFLEGGVGEYPPHIVSRMLTLWGMDIRGSVDNEGASLFIDLDALDDSGLNRAFAFVHALMAKPRWDVEAFERARKEMIHSFEASFPTLEFKMGVEMGRRLYQGLECLLPAYPNVLQSYNLDEIKGLVNAQIQPELIEVTVVGDFEESVLVKALLRYLGTIPPRVVHPSHREFAVAYQKTGKLSVPTIKLFDKSEVFSAFQEDLKCQFASGGATELVSQSDLSGSRTESTTPVFPNSPLSGEGQDLTIAAGDHQPHPERCMVVVALQGCGRYRSLEGPSYLDELPLSIDGQMDEETKSKYNNRSFRFRVWRFIEDLINERLYNEMREKRGLGYASDIGTASFEMSDIGVISLTMTPAPEVADIAWDSLWHVLWNLCDSEPPTPKEFAAVRTPLLLGITSNLRVNSYWMALCFGLQLPNHAKTLEQIHRIRSFYENITLDDVIAVIRRDIRPFPSITCVAMSGPPHLKQTLATMTAHIEQKVKRLEEQVLGQRVATFSPKSWRSYWPVEGWPEEYFTAGQKGGQTA